MKRTHAIATFLAFSLWPASAFAQAAPTHWSALYAGPIFLAAALLLLGIRAVLHAPGWNRLGIMLWTLIMTAGACLAIYAMAGVAQGKVWQAPALVIAFVLFVYVGQNVLSRLQRP
jgi:hypothetical protein